MNVRPIRDYCLTGTDANARILADKCPQCAQVFYPKGADFCLNCLHAELETIELSSEGKLYSWSRSEVPTHKMKPPYVCGFVELPEGIRLFAPMHPDADESVLKSGLPVDIVVGEVWRTEEESVIGYHFKPQA